MGGNTKVIPKDIGWTSWLLQPSLNTLKTTLVADNTMLARTCHGMNMLTTLKNVKMTPGCNWPDYGIHFGVIYCNNVEIWRVSHLWHYTADSVWRNVCMHLTFTSHLSKDCPKGSHRAIQGWNIGRNNITLNRHYQPRTLSWFDANSRNYSSHYCGLQSCSSPGCGTMRWT